MPITDEEKLEFSKQAFKAKIMQIDTWDSFKSMIGGITPVKVRNLVLSALAVRKQSAAASIITAGESVEDIEELETELSA